ncbi:MAG: hypothetical protein QG635_126, partial [Bacteroidota bacterium]|nr:hypothetical protein [Bacteroidota bacterium]
EYRRKYTNNELLTVPSDDRPFDWLVRYSGQMHYTFGVAVDKDFLFRFGIGFTIYGVESWQQLKSFEVDPLTQDTNTVQIYSNVVNGKIESNNKTIGGLSGKMEFMAQAMSTPFGIGLQYFDEALSINGWFQIPLVRNLLSMRLEVNGYVPAFRKEQHAWENKSVVIPTLRFIVVF